VTATPDRADFTFGVHALRQTAKGAVAATAVKMQRVINALKDYGVATRDLQTQGISVYASYANDVLSGYNASNSVTVKVRDIDKAGVVIDVAVNAGATSVWGPSLFRTDQQLQARSAIRAAVNDARAKAEAAAAASGATVGRLVGVTEGGAVPTPGTGTTGATTGVVAMPSVPTPVQAGEQSFEITVSATFVAQ
jgi:uncharacterized protein